MSYIFVSKLFVLFYAKRLAAVFNYEIGARVNDKASDLTYLISRTLKVSFMDIRHNLVNLSNPSLSCQHLFFSAQTTFLNEIASLYVGLENGEFFSYDTLSYDPYIIGYGQTIAGSKPIKSLFSVNDDGFPVAYLRNSSYNVRGRPWYRLAKSIKINYWTDPYIDAASGNPVVSLIYPILNYTLNGRFLSYAGSLAADVYLTQISAYLVKAYHDTDMNVFVVDQGTMSLLGNSLGAMTYVPGPGGTKVRY